MPDEERHLRREIEVQEIETNIFSVKDTFVMANIFEKPITEDDKKSLMQSSMLRPIIMKSSSA